MNEIAMIYIINYYILENPNKYIYNNINDIYRNSDYKSCGL